MFDKMKQLKQLKEIQNELKNEKTKVEKDGIKAIFNGSMELEELKLDNSLPLEKQEEIIISLFNEAIKKIQTSAASKMSQIKGLGF